MNVIPFSPAYPTATAEIDGEQIPVEPRGLLVTAEGVVRFVVTYWHNFRQRGGIVDELTPHYT